MRTRLVVIRHAPTHAMGRCVGRTEVDVQVPPEEAARAVAAACGVAPTIVWSSPQARCADPAAIAARLLGATHRIDARLSEIDYGVFEGRWWAELEREAPDALARWMERWEHEGPPKGESARAVEARVRAWWNELEAGDALLVAHAGVARALRVIVAGASWPDAMRVAIPHLAIDAVHVRG
ncbi:MAG: hypothetical protein OHK0013_07690 [Sandaracinaceae bacterium]